MSYPQWLVEELGLTPEEIEGSGSVCSDCPGGLMCCISRAMADYEDD